MARVEELRNEYADVAEFAFVYIKEAHPEDEWQMDSNEEDEIVYNQPMTFAERLGLAQTFVSEMDVKTTTLVDDISNTANACYSAWPERIYIVDTEGKIVFKGGMGPFYFNPEEIAEFLDEHYPSTASG